MRRRGKLPLPAAVAALATTAVGVLLLSPGQAQAHQGTGATRAPADTAVGQDRHATGTAGRHHGHGHPPGHGHRPPHHHHHHHHDHPHPPTDPGGPPPTDPGEPMTCMALYNVTEEHPGGFTGQVEVMNHGTEPMVGWTVTWQPGVGTEITAVQDGTLAHHGDGTVSVRNVESNATVPPDDEVVFTFTADSTGADFPIGSMGCTSP
ncbi:hypothetical protein GCM10018793_42250 [Streptomyces sulfonofaciens]|uniref:CBM2 domain-containing protein n=1 Tax=Streptomyces sulfonofaciens TaxID=68272 RepID=A0A919GDD7_9ACTN|nr:cellulose binding domain-containing protein [Streptomyces sulfonofaciens]GHH82431.1 hypothetical protein GCM10018793_42250 [Streptomyces sulfonofaciens]